MVANSVVRARVDEKIKIKAEAEAVLASVGLTVSSAFRMMLIRIAKGKALPFEPLVPNDETIEAMRAARRGELTTAGTADRLLEKLDAGDQVYGPLQTRLQAREIGAARQVDRCRTDECGTSARCRWTFAPQ